MSAVAEVAVVAREGAVGVPMLGIGGGKSEPDREIRRDAERQPSSPQPRREQRYGGGHRQQVAGGAGEEQDERSREKQRDPGREKTHPRVGAPAPCKRDRSRQERGEHEETRVARQRDRAS